MQLPAAQGGLVPDVQQPEETTQLPEGCQEELDTGRQLLCSVCRGGGGDAHDVMVIC